MDKISTALMKDTVWPATHTMGAETAPYPIVKWVGAVLAMSSIIRVG